MPPFDNDRPTKIVTNDRIDAITRDFAIRDAELYRKRQDDLDKLAQQHRKQRQDEADERDRREQQRQLDTQAEEDQDTLDWDEAVRVWRTQLPDLIARADQRVHAPDDAGERQRRKLRHRAERLHQEKYNFMKAIFGWRAGRRKMRSDLIRPLENEEQARLTNWAEYQRAYDLSDLDRTFRHQQLLMHVQRTAALAQASGDIYDADRATQQEEDRYQHEEGRAETDFNTEEFEYQNDLRRMHRDIASALIRIDRTYKAKLRHIYEVRRRKNQRPLNEDYYDAPERVAEDTYIQIVEQYETPDKPWEKARINVRETHHYIRKMVGDMPWIERVQMCTVLSIDARRHRCTVSTPAVNPDGTVGGRIVINNVQFGETAPRKNKQYVIRIPGAYRDNEVTINPGLAWIKIPPNPTRWLYWLQTGPHGTNSLYRMSWAPPKALRDLQPHENSWPDPELVQENIPTHMRIAGSNTPDDNKPTQIVFASAGPSERPAVYPDGMDPQMQHPINSISPQRLHYYENMGFGHETQVIDPTPPTVEIGGLSNYGNSYAGTDYTFTGVEGGQGATVFSYTRTRVAPDLSCHFHSDEFDPPLDGTVVEENWCEVPNSTVTNWLSYGIDKARNWLGTGGSGMGNIGEHAGTWTRTDGSITDHEMFCPIAVAGDCIWSPSLGGPVFLEVFYDNLLIETIPIGIISVSVYTQFMFWGRKAWAFQYGGTGDAAVGIGGVFVFDSLQEILPPELGGFNVPGYQPKYHLHLYGNASGGIVPNPGGKLPGDYHIRMTPDNEIVIWVVFGADHYPTEERPQWYRNTPGNIAVDQPMNSVYRVGDLSIDGFDAYGFNYDEIPVFTTDGGETWQICTNFPDGLDVRGIFVDEAGDGVVVPPDRQVPGTSN